MRFNQRVTSASVIQVLVCNAPTDRYVAVRVNSASVGTNGSFPGRKVMSPKLVLSSVLN